MEIGDLPEDAHRHFRQVRSVITVDLFSNIPEHVRNYARDAKEQGWNFYCVDQTRGRCYFGSKVITVPKWVLTMGDKKIWYLSHELAHAYNAKTNDSHGPNFMSWLKIICPEEYQHYELGYKPRNATQAGITRKGEL